jgi:hypothetical protein
LAGLDGELYGTFAEVAYECRIIARLCVQDLALSIGEDRTGGRVCVHVRQVAPFDGVMAAIRLRAVSTRRWRISVAVCTQAVWLTERSGQGQSH